MRNSVDVRRAAMCDTSRRQILVVDDEASIRESLEMLLTSAGYDVAIAKDGFDALLQIKRSLPDVIVSDLNMPQMSGFEFLSVVRRRFPQILVVAMSGAYGGDAVPDGIIADAFYAKGGSHVETLLSTVADLIQTSVARAHAHRTESAPVWIPRNGKDSDGVPYIVLTCTECLRSFPLNVTEEANPEVQETLCLFCPNKVRYIIDFSRSVVSPQKRLGDVLYADKSRARVSEDEWVELVRAVAGGDQRALHYLYGQMSRIVFTLVLRIIKNRETAEEVTVDVFYNVWRRASTYDPGNGSVAGWIMNQARCRAIDRLRFDQKIGRASCRERV